MRESTRQKAYENCYSFTCSCSSSYSYHFPCNSHSSSCNYYVIIVSVNLVRIALYVSSYTYRLLAREYIRLAPLHPASNVEIHTDFLAETHLGSHPSIAYRSGPAAFEHVGSHAKPLAAVSPCNFPRGIALLDQLCPGASQICEALLLIFSTSRQRCRSYTSAPANSNG